MQKIRNTGTCMHSSKSVCARCPKQRYTNNISLNKFKLHSGFTAKIHLQIYISISAYKTFCIKAATCVLQQLSRSVQTGPALVVVAEMIRPDGCSEHSIRLLDLAVTKRLMLRAGSNTTQATHNHG